MLIKQQLMKGQGPSIPNPWDIKRVESQQPEQSRMELELRLGFKGSGTIQNYAKTIIEYVVTPANNIFKSRGVDTWPEEKDIVIFDGNSIRARWYKNPIWAEVIVPVLQGLFAIAIIASIVYIIFWVLNRYYPATAEKLKSGIALIVLGVLGVVAVIVTPSLLQLYQERY